MKSLACLFILLFNIALQAHELNISKDQNNTVNVYLLPGHGSDYRLYADLEFPENYCIHHINYVLPEKGSSMKEYALLLSKQVETNQSFVLIGTSLGGMLASEMSEILNPDHVILLASAKNKDELPFKYTFQRYFPVYKLVGGRALIKRQNNATHL